MAAIFLTFAGKSAGGGAWAQQAYVKASNTGESDLFGSSVAISGNTMVVAASQEDSNATSVNGNQTNNSAENAGAAYVFVRTGAMWVQQAYLKPSNGTFGNGFGWSVAISGDTIVIGAVFKGAAYVFVRNGVTWSQQANLTPSNAEAGDYFGESVAISGNTVVIGAPGEDSVSTGVNGNQSNNSAQESGAAYVFVRNGTAWSQQAYVKASNTGASDAFGIGVTIDGDTMVVGAQGEDSSANSVNGNASDNSAENAGAAYVFVRSGITWNQQAYLKASNARQNTYFGIAVSVSSDAVAVGGIYGGDDGAGTAYVFSRSGVTWTERACLTSPNGASSPAFAEGFTDYFGVSVSLSQNMLLVGARGDNRNITGVNGNGTDGGATDSGAAHLFVWDGTSWVPQAYLKASNTGGSIPPLEPDGDSFGKSVAVSGNTIVIGAAFEDSNATGAGGNQNNNSIHDSGAAYVFTFIAPPAPISTVDRTMEGLLLTLPVAAGQSVGVHYSETMLSGTWLDIGNFSVTGGVGAFTDRDPVRLARPAGYYRGFYRLGQ
jgi:hypothetical protein